MKKSRLLFTPNKKNINAVSNNILAWIEANNNPYYNKNNPDVKRDIPLSYDEYKKNINIYYTLSPIKKGEISPNHNMTYLDFIQILKSHNLNILADKIENSLRKSYLNSI